MIELNEQDNVDPLKLKNSHIRTAIRQRFEKNWIGGRPVNVTQFSYNTI